MKNRILKPKRPLNEDLKIPRNKPGYGSVYVWNVPLKLRAAFKATCARKGITVSQAMTQLMEGFADPSYSTNFK